MFVRPCVLASRRSKDIGTASEEFVLGACFPNSQKQAYLTHQVYSSVKRS
jgi:hypothetical protein